MLIETTSCPYCGNGSNTPCFARYTDGFKCFSCGIFKKSDRGLIQARSATIDDSLTMPQNINKNPATFTLEGQIFLLRYFITTNVAKNYNIWETDRHSFIFPVFDAEILLNGNIEKTVFYVERYYDEKRIFNNGSKVEMVLYGSRTANTIVIVEDFLSAIRVHHAGFNSLCLFGTKIKYNKLEQYVKEFNNIILWLDGDKAGQSSARVLYSMITNQINKFNRCRSLVSCSKSVHNIRTELDPKLYKRKEIEKYIEQALGSR